MAVYPVQPEEVRLTALRGKGSTTALTSVGLSHEPEEELK
jgi:hypothetical protein